MTEPAPRTVEYYAISMLSSRTTWLGILAAVVGLGSDPELLAMIPLSWIPRILFVVGVAGIILRKLTVRPAALIAPGTTTPVEVTRIGPPPPVTPTD